MPVLFATSTRTQQHDERVAIHFRSAVECQPLRRIADDEAEIARARTAFESIGTELAEGPRQATARRDAADVRSASVRGANARLT